MENPQAFPSTEVELGFSGKMNKLKTYGMTLRDYFAGQALAIIAGKYKKYIGTNFQGTEEIVNDCYKIADAMLKERTKQEGEENNESC